MILASLKIHEEKQEEDEDKITHLPSHTLHIGDILAATYVLTSCLIYHTQNSSYKPSILDPFTLNDQWPHYITQKHFLSESFVVSSYNICINA